MSQRRALKKAMVDESAPDLLPDANELHPLETGDKLTRDEFERRFDAMPNLKKAELINGIVYMGSPVKQPTHSSPHSVIVSLLGVYRILTPGVDSGDNGTMRLDLDNEPQPDAFLRIEEECGGQSSISDDEYLKGAPELVVEVASSSASYDLHMKREVYRRHGVREYIVWRPRDKAMDWFELQRGRYARIKPDRNGVIESKVFPGFRLAVTALLKEDYATALEELHSGLTSARHKAFIATLAKRRKKKKK